MPLSTSDQIPCKEQHDPTDTKRRRNSASDSVSSAIGGRDLKRIKREKGDDMDDSSMDFGDSGVSGGNGLKEPLQPRRSNFGQVNNGFNRNAASMDHCKPGSVKKLTIKNLKGKAICTSTKH